MKLEFLLSPTRQQTTQQKLCELYEWLKPYTYILTPWIIVLLEKLTGLQLVKKFPEFYGTRRFITTFTSARNLLLS